VDIPKCGGSPCCVDYNLQTVPRTSKKETVEKQAKLDRTASAVAQTDNNKVQTSPHGSLTVLQLATGVSNFCMC